MTLALLHENCFGFPTETYLYEPTISSFFMLIALAIISLGVFKLRRKETSDFINTSEETYKLPGRDFLQLEKPYSHPHEVYVPYSARLTSSPIVKAVIIISCILLIFVPLQLTVL